jgi:tetratricopeptide (TPR) repeat protein
VTASSGVTPASTWRRPKHHRRLFNPDPKAAHTGFAPDQDNIRSALAYLDAHGPAEEAVRLMNAIAAFWLVHGQISEGFGWVARLIERGVAVRAEQLCELLVNASDFARPLGHTALATSYAERGLEIARDLDDALLVEKALHELAESVQVTGDYDRAVALYDEERELALSLGRSGSGAVTNLSDVALARGEFERARSLAEEAIALAGENRADETHVVATFNLGSALLQLDRIDEARAPLREAIDRSSDVGYTHILGWSLIAAAALTVRCGSTADGARLLGAGRAHVQRHEELLGPAEQQLLTATEERLGAGFEAELDEGALMPLDAALELARLSLD